MFCLGHVFCVMALVFIASKVNPLSDNIDDENYGITWIYFPDGNGVPTVVNLTDYSYYKVNTENKPTFFELYTRAHMTSPITIPADSPEDLVKLNSAFLPNVETKIVTHGWKSSSSSDSVKTIKDAYLRKRACNVIGVNWQKLANTTEYIPSAVNTKVVGQFIAKLIDYLHQTLGASLKSIHIIGHSLGGHVAGYAGQFTKGKVGRITGLDPAMPWFHTAKKDNRLDPSDAEFVDVIHTCGGFLGLKETVGTVDFYPNGGTKNQPGCDAGSIYDKTSCSHSRSYQFFAESIETGKGFYGHECSSTKDASAGKCNKNPTVLMGDILPMTTRGIFYLQTNAVPPFAKGNV